MDVHAPRPSRAMFAAALPSPALRRSVAGALLTLVGACAANEPPVDIGLSSAPDAAPDQVLRFLAVGDTGKGNDVQRQVAAAMKKACDARGGCAFSLLVGDNIYQDGPTGLDDPQLETKFEKPYEGLDFPFYVALGNHDYGGNGSGWEFWKAKDEVGWTAKSAKWKLPARHYAFTGDHVDFFAVDTEAIWWGYEADQHRALQARRQASTRPWKIAFGHHPFLSNGRHGDAGHYDGLPAALPGSGSRWRDFFDDELCGKVDLYVSGHDHTLQDLGEACGVTLVVSGAGSSPTPLGRRDRGLFSVSTPGFAMFEVTARELTLRFFDAAGTELHARTRTRER